MDIITLASNNMADELTQKIFEPKLAITASIGAAESIRDYGGMWKVDGMFLLEGAKALNCKRAEMIDKFKTPGFEEAAKNIEAEVIYTELDFRELGSSDLAPVEVSLLNDVLLHQNNFTKVIKQECAITTKYIAVNQPFYEGFAIPSSCSLLQFMPIEWKKKLWNVMWIDQRELDEFSVDIWMWAQSKQLMIDIFKGYGWKPKQDRGYTFSIDNGWEYAGILFDRI